MTKHRYVGSDFDSFLEEDGILEDYKEEAAQRKGGTKTTS